MTTAEAEILSQKNQQTDSPTARRPLLLRKLRITLATLIVATLTYFYSHGQLTQENLKLIIAALPTWLFIPTYLLLPLLGFPISVVLLASGLKYGFGPSVAIAAGAMASHTFCAWRVAHGYFREWLESWLSRTRFACPTIPEHHQIWFTSVFVTVPGLPYAVKLYSLALTNLSFRRYFLVIWICHVMNSVLFIGMGAAASDIDMKPMMGLGVLVVVMIAVSNWLKRPMEHQSHSACGLVCDSTDSKSVPTD